VRQLTSVDALFLRMEDARTYGHVAGLGIVDPREVAGGALTLAAVEASLVSRLHMIAPFRWRLVEVPLGLDHPYWVESPEFDPEFHIREVTLPPPGTDAQLAEEVARIIARPLDRARPLWELYLFHGVRGDRQAVLTKAHHALIDGASGAEIMTTMLDDRPEGREIPPALARATEPSPDPLALFAKALLSFRWPPAIDDADGLHDVLDRPAVPAPRTLLNGRVSSGRRVAFGPLSLSAVKDVKRAFGTTVNDVVIALCAGALREWLLAIGELPAEPLHTVVPVSVRAENEKGTFGNRVSMLIVPMPTDEPDPRRRLERAHETLRDAKERHGALPADLMTRLADFVPPVVHAQASRGLFRAVRASRDEPLANLIVSNVPGPREQLYLCGAPVETWYPVSGIASGMRLNISLLSYRDDLDFCVVVDRDLMTDPQRIIDALGTGLDELVRLSPSART